jgi:hypothetical protein
MSTLREKLQAELSRYDDDAFAALANRGLLRRARKDLEKEAALIASETPQALLMKFAGHEIRFDARGAAHASCSCPANGVCQHILAAAICLQAAPAAATSGAAVSATASVINEPAPASPASGTADPLADLRGALLRMTPRELTKHCGKAGYRWAWQFVEDLDPEQDLTLSGERNVVIAFRHPRLSFRYMGGTVDSLLADAEVRQVEKYRVAAVLAYQRAHGAVLEAPEAATPQAGTLDLGKDHAVSEGASASLRESRARLCASVRALATECVALGLAHLSPGIQERFSTLAVWAQGAQAYRLALLLRRIADHAEMLLERAGGADEHRLMNELTIAFALVSALEAAAERGSTPAALIGRARNEYEDTGQLELLGLGASAWRSASGFVGLTMLFWSPADRRFYSCSDARPEIQRFDPGARYKAAGPWSGLGAPALTTGRRVVLSGALTSAAGRISGSEKSTATVMPRDAAEFIARLETQSRWSELVQARAEARRSLLAEAQPMRDWVILRPTRCGRAEFDAARQVLSWPLMDDQGARLLAELAYDKYTAPAIERLEQLEADVLPDGTLVVARLRGGSSHFIAEPLSLVRPGARDSDEVVDALYFDAAPKTGIAGRILSSLRRRTNKTELAPVMPSAVPPLLIELRQWLLRQAERGVAWDVATQARRELQARRERLGAAGFNAFGALSANEDTAGDVLRATYLCMQYEHLLDDAGEGLLA